MREMLKKKIFTELFLDGVLTPTISENFIVTDDLEQRFPFGDRTIGVKRYWESRSQDVEITRLVSVPLYAASIYGFKTGGIVELQDYASEGKKDFYKIEQVQVKPDTSPPCLYLSLTNDSIHITDRRGESGSDSAKI